MLQNKLCSKQLIFTFSSKNSILMGATCGTGNKICSEQLMFAFSSIFNHDGCHRCGKNKSLHFLQKLYYWTNSIKFNLGSWSVLIIKPRKYLHMEMSKPSGLFAEDPGLYYCCGWSWWSRECHSRDAYTMWYWQGMVFL